MTYFSTCNLQIYCDLNPLIEFSQLLQQFTTQSITKEQITQYNQYVEQINQMADKFVSYYNILIQTTAFVLKKIKNKINEDQLIKIQSHLNHYKTCHTYFLRKRPPTIQYQNNHF
jgi:glutathionylspermidine synthase